MAEPNSKRDASNRKSKVHRERDARALSRLALLLFCGLVLAGGFVFAAQQHFAAVQYGYKSESLRRERERLLAEQQHLMLKREQAAAPARLEAAARELGLKPLLPGQVGTQKANNQSPPKAPARLNPAASLHRP
jgi:cell division protein FtsL